MSVNPVKEYLNKKHVKYLTIEHSPAFTAQEIAALAHVPGKDMAKTVVVKMDGKLRLAVLPASAQVDFERLQRATGAEEIALATESDFGDRFPDCELGAMPPFGHLYGMPVYVAKGLTEDDKIVFNAGNHHELIQLAYEDFERLEEPTVVDMEA